MHTVTPSLPDAEMDLVGIRRRARELQKAFQAGDPDARALVEQHRGRAGAHAFRLSDALTVLARLHGCENWSQLRAALSRVNAHVLAAAVRAGNRRRVRALLRLCPGLVHLDLADNNEHRALHHAVKARNVDLVRLLMAAGADARKGIYPHRDATTAHTIARERGYEEIVAAIEEAERARRAAAGSPTPDVPAPMAQFAAALRREDAPAALALVAEHPALLTAADHAGSTLLHLTAAGLSEAVIGALLAQGLAVDTCDFQGRTPLDCAALAVEWRRPESLEGFRRVGPALRAAGAALSPASAVALGEAEWVREEHAARPEVLRTCRSLEGGLLTLAVQHRREEMVSLLLDLGLDPDERTAVGGLDEPAESWGMPLWHAVGSRQYVLAEQLLRRGADPNGDVYASGTPVFQAYGQRDARLKELLQQYGGRPHPSTLGEYRETAAARAFLEGADICRPTLRDAGETGILELLWGAACGGDPEIVRLCLERLDWSRDDPRWFRVLEQPLRLWNHGPGHWVSGGAAQFDRTTYPVCFRLILARCDPNVTGRWGLCMLHRVAGAGDARRPAVMTDAERNAFATLLLDAGARLDLRDDVLCSTPLGWAARWGRAALVRLLRDRGAPAVEPDAEPWAQPRAWAARTGDPELLRLLE